MCNADETHPNISVIIPVFNAERYLCQCMDSVTEQALEKLEVISIEDGLTDGSLEMLKEYEQNKQGVTIISRENRGAGLSRNEGIQVASGEFVAFMDADDFYPSKTTLLELYAHAKENNATICGGSLTQIYENGREVFSGGKLKFGEDGFIGFRDYQFPYFYQRFIYKRDLIIENGIYFPDYIRYQDVPFMVRAFVTAGRFYAVKASAYCYRLSHKPVYTTSIMTDIAKALKDCPILSRTNRLSELHVLMVDVVTRNIAHFRKYAGSDLLSEVVNEIDYTLMS